MAPRKNNTIQNTNGQEVTVPAQIAFTLTDETELPQRVGGPGRQRNTAWDELVRQLETTGRVAKIEGNEDDVKATLKGMRAAMSFLYPGRTVAAQATSAGSLLVKAADQMKRGPRKPKTDEQVVTAE